MTTPENASVKEFAQLLSRAGHVAVMTGAGMSAESGIPTFRDAKSGLWAQYDPEKLATADAYRADKALVWGWYRWRMTIVERAQPNAGHFALAVLEQMLPSVVVLTQNVDNLHERAGSRDVTHLHGSLFAPRCFACARPYSYESDSLSADAESPLRVAPPNCLSCGGPVRPGVVWFGEQLPDQAWARAEQELERCDVLLVVGTSGIVHPAAGLPILVKERGKPVVEINPVRSGLTALADVVYHVTAAEALPKIVEAVRTIRKGADGDKDA